MAQAPRGWSERQRALMRAQARRAARRRAAARQGSPLLLERLARVRPWLITGGALALLGVAMFVISVIALAHRQREMADALIPVGVMVVVTSSAPLMLGFLRFIEPPQTNQHRCGRCRFYQPTTDAYARGWCAVERPRTPTTSEAGCGRFQFSERAMVRERLSQAPHVLNSRTEA